MQGDDLEVGSSRRIRDGEGTTLHIWRFGTGNFVLDNQPASGWHRPLRLGSSLLCCSALATWELDIRLPTHTISIFVTYTVQILPFFFVTSNLVHAVYGWLACWGI
jgi:hypothetical protein